MKKLLFNVSIMCVMASCGKSGAGNSSSTSTTTSTTSTTGTPAPDAAVLSAPANNSACTTGTTVSATRDSIAFSWNAGNNAESYVLYVKNLLDSTVIMQNTTETNLTVLLSTNTPYAWYVVSKSGKTADTAKSSIWKFYDAGPGAVSFAPFPADSLSPALGQLVTAASGVVNLSWQGSSVGGNIAGYDIYFGTSPSPAIFKSNVTDPFLNNVPVSPGVTYYWKVVTKDTNGNSSDSGLYQFVVS